MLPGNFGIDFVFPKKQYSLWNIEDHFFQLKYFILSFNYIVKKEIKKNISTQSNWYLILIIKIRA
jgi:REP element-mobilizing transposase RayT